MFYQAIHLKGQDIIALNALSENGSYGIQMFTYVST